MKRRYFLSSMALAVPAAIIGPGLIFSSCKSDVMAEPFSADDIKLLDEIGETIIPASASSPGAKAAKIGDFMKVYVTDCYTAADQEVFAEGIVSFKKLCSKTYSKNFLELPVSQKRELLKILEKEVAEHAKAKQEKKPEGGDGDAVQAGKAEVDQKAKLKGNADHYFTMMKNLTLFGYFTSEHGATKALRYMQTPGHYTGDIPYKAGDKSWAM